MSNLNGEFLTKVVIPETKFTATFEKLGYLDLKEILQNQEVNQLKYTIMQVSQVK